MKKNYNEAKKINNFKQTCDYINFPNMLKRYLNEEKKNKKDYYTTVFNKMAANGQAINYYDCEGYFWKEIDTVEDYEKALKDFAVAGS